MPDVRIRRAAAADLPALTRLWQTAFGDPPELIGAFYNRFPPAGCIRPAGPFSPAPMSMRSPPIRRSRDMAMRRR